MVVDWNWSGRSLEPTEGAWGRAEVGRGDQNKKHSNKFLFPYVESSLVAGAARGPPATDGGVGERPVTAAAAV